MLGAYFSYRKSISTVQIGLTTFTSDSTHILKQKPPTHFHYTPNSAKMSLSSTHSPVLSPPRSPSPDTYIDREEWDDSPPPESFYESLLLHKDPSTNLTTLLQQTPSESVLDKYKDNVLALQSVIRSKWEGNKYGATEISTCLYLGQGLILATARGICVPAGEEDHMVHQTLTVGENFDAVVGDGRPVRLICSLVPLSPEGLVWDSQLHRGNNMVLLELLDKDRYKHLPVIQPAELTPALAITFLGRNSNVAICGRLVQQYHPSYQPTFDELHQAVVALEPGLVIERVSERWEVEGFALGYRVSSTRRSVGSGLFQGGKLVGE
ncbi:hypothetical protein BJ508DRAFT_50630 [Ascobolus immersus RN42]|uniref:Uncharacterized protein n=1 Tax=Ascobolus immersus RN42 TaxID=1160509 RepID=A0A3N4ICD5_ASCIM|nr:hypothetical protein BJ508DRAFT_50630 [Ascobolus immersus RN42]